MNADQYWDVAQAVQFLEDKAKDIRERGQYLLDVADELSDQASQLALNSGNYESDILERICALEKRFEGCAE